MSAAEGYRISTQPTAWGQQVRFDVPGGEVVQYYEFDVLARMPVSRTASTQEVVREGRGGPTYFVYDPRAGRVTEKTLPRQEAAPAWETSPRTCPAPEPHSPLVHATVELRDDGARRAARRLRDPHTGEDVAQESVLRALRRTGPEPDDAEAFAAAVQNRVMQEELRRRKHRACLSFDEDDHTRHPAWRSREPEAPDSGLRSTERSQQVRAAVGSLQPDWRESFLLTFVCELTAPEVAQMLGVRPAAIRKRLERIRTSLRGRLAGLL